MAINGGCGGGSDSGASTPGATAQPIATPIETPAPGEVTSGRGFPALSPWVSCYGSASDCGDLGRMASTFRIINIDADPATGNFSPTQITQLKAGGRNRVISYLNLGSMESFRSYWNSAPAGFVSGKANKTAQVGAYDGYPNETWMDVGNAEYQRLMVDYVAPRLVAQGADGFFLDNMEIVEHGPNDKNGACSASCRQGGLDLVRRLREKYPQLLIVMQNATGDITRTGRTGTGRTSTGTSNVAFPSLLDGISHEEVYAPDANAEAELKAWQALKLRPGGREFWIATEDYVGSASGSAKAREVYGKSRANGFSPYAADESGKQQTVFYWPF